MKHLSLNSKTNPPNLPADYNDWVRLMAAQGVQISRLSNQVIDRDYFENSAYKKIQNRLYNAATAAEVMDSMCDAFYAKYSDLVGEARHILIHRFKMVFETEKISFEL